VVVSISRKARTSEAGDHILFVGSSEEKPVTKILEN
jgi:hypothetical protein